MLPFCTPVVDRYPWSKTTSATECTAIRILAPLMLQKPAFLLVCAIVRFFILMPCKRLKKGSVGRCVVRSKKESVNRNFSLFLYLWFTINLMISDKRVSVCVFVYIKNVQSHIKRGSSFFSNRIFFFPEYYTVHKWNAFRSISFRII